MWEVHKHFKSVCPRGKNSPITLQMKIRTIPKHSSVILWFRLLFNIMIFSKSRKYYITLQLIMSLKLLNMYLTLKVDSVKNNLLQFENIKFSRFYLTRSKMCDQIYDVVLCRMQSEQKQYGVQPRHGACFPSKHSSSLYKVWQNVVTVTLMCA